MSEPVIVVRDNNTGKIIVRTTGFAIAPTGGGGAVVRTWVSKTANYTLTANDYGVLMNATSGNKVATLPSAAANSGKEFEIIKTDASANTVTVSGVVNGDAVLTLQDEALSVCSDGTSWRIT